MSIASTTPVLHQPTNRSESSSNTYEYYDYNSSQIRRSQSYPVSSVSYDQPYIPIQTTNTLLVSNINQQYNNNNNNSKNNKDDRKYHHQFSTSKRS